MFFKHHLFLFKFCLKFERLFLIETVDLSKFQPNFPFVFWKRKEVLWRELLTEKED